MCGWEVIEDDESSATRVQPLKITACQPGALPWQSSRGYEVTHDGWILSPTQKRLLWLPHRWRSDEEDRKWGGAFLGYYIVAYRRLSFSSFSIDLVVRAILFTFGLTARTLFLSSNTRSHSSFFPVAGIFPVIPACTCPNRAVLMHAPPHPQIVSIAFSIFQCCHSRRIRFNFVFFPSS